MTASPPARRLGEAPAAELLEPIERASVEELRALQRERLAWTLRHAYENVPHYRRAFDGAGVSPADFRDMPDLSRFPFTTKADLRANYPFGMFAVPQERVARMIPPFGNRHSVCHRNRLRPESTATSSGGQRHPVFRPDLNGRGAGGGL